LAALEPKERAGAFASSPWPWKASGSGLVFRTTVRDARSRMMVEVNQHSVNDKSNDEPEGCLQNSSETWGHRFAFADSNL